jgi:hypothetical protein
MSALDTFLQFLIWVLSLLGVDMLGCVAVEGAPLYPTGLEGIHSGCLNQALLYGGGLSWSSDLNRQVQCGPARSWCVSSGQLFPPTGQTWELGLSAFCWEQVLLISACYQFLQGGRMCCDFPKAMSGLHYPHTGWISSVLKPHSHQAQVKISLHLLGHQFCPGGVQSSPKLHWSIFSE